MADKKKAKRRPSRIGVEAGDLIIEREGVIIQGYDPDRPDESPDPPPPAYRKFLPKEPS
jgi:hypothetical protein